MFDEDLIEAACRTLNCRFEWESDQDIEVTLPEGKTFPSGSRRKVFDIEAEPIKFIVGYIRDAAG